MLKKNNINTIINLLIMTLLLVIIVFGRQSHYEEPEDIEEQSNLICPKELETEYQEDTIYYQKLSYKKFKKKLAGNDLVTIGIIDSTSPTNQKFLELINRTAYSTNEIIYILDISKISKKNTIEFYDIDERLSNLEYNYIMRIKDNKIYSITEYNQEELNTLIEKVGD